MNCVVQPAAKTRILTYQIRFYLEPSDDKQ